MNLKKVTFLVVLLFALSKSASSQESMLNELSYLYMEKLIAVAKENYPRHKIFEHQAEAAKARIAEQKSAWLDPFSFSYTYRSNTQNGNGIDLVNAGLLLSGYQFGVSVSPSIFLKNPSRIKVAKEEAKVAQYAADEYGLTLEAEVKRRYLVYLQNFNLLKLRTKAMLDNEASFKLIKARYERNEITFQDYNNGALAQTAAYEAKITSEAELAVAKASLEEMLTKKLEEIK